MKARICDACKRTIPDSNKKIMLYNVEIVAAVDFEADTREETKLFLELDDVCSSCTAKIKAAIEFIVKGAKEDERSKNNHRSKSVQQLKRSR